MTTLFLMRHSIAVPADFQTTDDSRWLTERGRTLASVAGSALEDELARLGLGMACIVTSPLVRTVQTAELVAARLGYQGEIRAMHSLRSEFPTQRALDALGALGHEVVLAVTHEPLVSAMSSLHAGAGHSGFGAGYQPSEVCGFFDGEPLWRHRP